MDTILDYDLKIKNKKLMVFHPGSSLGTAAIENGQFVIETLINKIDEIKKLKKTIVNLKSKSLPDDPIWLELLLKIERL